MTAEKLDAPVKKSIVVKADVERAFRVFTAGIDTWWPRDHHIGKSPMKKVVVENFQGGRCYSAQVDGTDCDWGKVLVWEPPRRLVLAWQINVDWKYEPDLAKSTEVEVCFFPEPDGTTRVELKHKHFERLGGGPGVEKVRSMLERGWVGTMQLFGARAEQPE